MIRMRSANRDIGIAIGQDRFGIFRGMCPVQCGHFLIHPRANFLSYKVNSKQLMFISFFLIFIENLAVSLGTPLRLVPRWKQTFEALSQNSVFPGFRIYM